jgi:ubiquinone/menaquinone biosynthesis C-methylase UbiE
LDVFSQIQSLKEEIARLQTQAEEFSSSTMDSLAKLGIKSGMKVLDVGCGTGSVSFMISPIVGANGAVVGVDSNTYILEYCKDMAQKLDVTNVKFSEAEATKLDFEKQNFDATYSRFLFQHVPEAEKALREMIRVTRAGGHVMVEDCDLFTWIVYPENESVSKLWHWYESIQVERGTDPQIGRKLYSMFLDEGLKPTVDVYSKSVFSNKNKFWSSIIAVLNKVDNDQLKNLVKGIEEFSRLPNSIFVFPLVFRVWAKVN